MSKGPDLEKYKQILMKMKMQVMNGALKHSLDDLSISSDDLPDETDLAANIVNQEVTFNIKQRELEKIKAIDNALQRLKDGQFGHCEDCGEAIPEKRLVNRPWTTLCITHAEEKEREEKKFSRVS